MMDQQSVFESGLYVLVHYPIAYQELDPTPVCV